MADSTINYVQALCSPCSGKGIFILKNSNGDEINVVLCPKCNGDGLPTLSRPYVSDPYSNPPPNTTIVPVSTGTWVNANQTSHQCTGIHPPMTDVFGNPYFGGSCT